MIRTLSDLKLHVWRNLGLRRHLVGRRVSDDFVELTVQSWEPSMLYACVDREQRLVVCENTLRSVKRGYQVVSGKEAHEYGVFWAIVLQSVASLIVHLILRWWEDARMNRIRMEIWRTEMAR
jgi:hypothetical protein